MGEINQQIDQKNNINLQLSVREQVVHGQSCEATFHVTIHQNSSICFTRSVLKDQNSIYRAPKNSGRGAEVNRASFWVGICSLSDKLGILDLVSCHFRKTVC